MPYALHKAARPGDLLEIEFLDKQRALQLRFELGIVRTS
jgi:hypothetical protein